MTSARPARASIAFAILIALFMLSFFHRVAPGAMAGELQRTFGVGGAALGALAATYFYVYFLMQIPTGVLADTLGPRRVVTVGASVAGVGSLLFGLAQDLTTAVAGRAMVGLGVSVFFICLLKVAAEAYGERRFATATGVAVFSGNMGAVLAAAPLAWLVGRGLWRVVFAVVALLLILLAVAGWRFVVDPVRGGTGRTQGAVPWQRALWGVVKTPAIWPAVGAMFTAGATYATFIGLWAVPYLVQVRRMSAEAAASHTSIGLASFAVAAVAVGTLSDRIGRRRPILIGGLAVNTLCWIVLFAGWPLGPAASFTLFAVLGAAATSFTLLWACAKDACPPQLAGMSTSMVNTAQFLGVGLLQPAFGWILDRGWQGATREGMRVYSPADFQLGIGLLLACTVTGLMLAFLIPERPQRRHAAEPRPR